MQILTWLSQMIRVNKMKNIRQQWTSVNSYTKLLTHIGSHLKVVRKGTQKNIH